MALGTESVRQNEISAEVSRLGNELESLSGTIMELRERLKPVLSPELAPTPPTDRKSDPAPVTPMGLALREHSGRIEALTDEINALKARIEL